MRILYINSIKQILLRSDLKREEDVVDIKWPGEETLDITTSGTSLHHHIRFYLTTSVIGQFVSVLYTFLYVSAGMKSKFTG